MGEFGTRSIGIHLPKCKQKWEAQQESLPKAQRRPLPTAPENFDKIISGEIKGKDLMKMNQQAFDDYNTSVLEPCSNCGRTFKPDALERHKKGCNEEKPMLKNKGPSYTSKMKSRVNYPTLKKSKENGKSGSNVSLDNAQETPTQSPNIIRKETVTISKTSQNENENGENVPLPIASSTFEHESDQMNLDNAKKSSTLTRKDTVVIQKNKNKDMQNDAADLNNPKSDCTSLPPLPPSASVSSSKSSSVPSTASSKATITPPKKDKPRKQSSLPTKEDVIYLVETEPIFDELEHRRAILDMVESYAKSTRKNHILQILDHEIFNNISNLEELITLLKDFVASKSNNNDIKI